MVQRIVRMRFAVCISRTLIGQVHHYHVIPSSVTLCSHHFQGRAAVHRPPIPYQTGHSTCPQHRTGQLHTTSTLSAADGQIATTWTKFVGLVQTFAVGLKSLYGDVKLMHEYKAKNGNLKITTTAPRVLDDFRTDLGYSREELQFFYRTVHDLKKMLPLCVLFMIPLVGYLAPIIAFKYPEKFLSQHFLTLSYRSALEASKCAMQKKNFSALLKLGMKEGNTPELTFLPGMVEQFVGGGKGTLDSSTSYYNIPQLTEEHLVHLYEGWDIRSLVQLRRKEKLQRHLEYVFASDWLIHLEGGVKRLSYSELVAACIERGLNFDLEVDEEERASEMEKKLTAWIQISTLHTGRLGF